MIRGYRQRIGGAAASLVLLVAASCSSSEPVAVNGVHLRPFLSVRAIEPLRDFGIDSVRAVPPLMVELFRLSLHETLAGFEALNVTIQAGPDTEPFAPEAAGVLGGGLVTRQADRSTPRGRRLSDFFIVDRPIDIFIDGRPIMTRAETLLRLIVTAPGSAGGMRLDDFLVSLTGEGAGVSPSAAIERVTRVVADYTDLPSPRLRTDFFQLMEGNGTRSFSAVRFVPIMVFDDFGFDDGGWPLPLHLMAFRTSKARGEASTLLDEAEAIALSYWMDSQAVRPRLTSVSSQRRAANARARAQEIGISLDPAVLARELGAIFDALPAEPSIPGLALPRSRLAFREGDWRTAFDLSLAARQAFAVANQLRRIECRGGIFAPWYGWPGGPDEPPRDTVIYPVPRRYLDRLPERYRAQVPRRVTPIRGAGSVVRMSDLFLRRALSGSGVPSSDAVRTVFEGAGRALGPGGRSVLTERLAAVQGLASWTPGRDYEVAALLAMLGRHEESVDLLRQLHQRRDLPLVGLEYDPAFRDIRDHPVVVGIVDAHYRRLEREEAVLDSFSTPASESLGIEELRALVEVCLMVS